MLETNKFFIPIISKEEYTLLQNKFTTKRVFNREKKSIYHNLQPFSDEFIITEDNYKCSFYLHRSKKRKKQILNLSQNNIPYDCDSINIPLKNLHYKISRKSIVYNSYSFISTGKISKFLINELSITNFKKTLLEKIINLWIKKIENKLEKKELRKKYLNEQISNLERQLKAILIDNKLIELSQIEKDLLEKEKQNIIK